MIGSFLTRGLVMVFGYAYPAYECYKTVEMNKPEIEQLRFWCQYWILVAVLTVCERIGDAFIPWVPMYSEAKLAFFIYLWYPKTKGTTYVYDSFFKPYVAKHENEIDHNLWELRTRAGDMAVLYWQRAASYSQSRVFEILQYVAAQSTPKPHLVQLARQQGSRAHQPPIPTRQPSAASNHWPAATQPETEESLSPVSSSSSGKNPLGVAEEVSLFRVSEADLPPVALNDPKANVTSETSSQSTRNEAEVMQIEVAPSSLANENVNPLPKEMVIQETSQVTRARLRKARSRENQKNA